MSTQIEIVPNVGKGATVYWETVPIIGDTVSWSYLGSNGEVKNNKGIVRDRVVSGNVVLIVERISLRQSKTTKTPEQKILDTVETFASNYDNDEAGRVLWGVFALRE
jgi:hypothetical protein